MGMTEPSMPAKSTLGLFSILSEAKRASKRSDWFCTKRGQWSEPGMIERRLLIIWQPLQMPRPKASARAKNAANSSRARGWKRMLLAQPSPAPSVSPKLNPPQAITPRKSFREMRPDRMSVMWTSMARKPARVSAAPISTWPLTPCSRSTATEGFVFTAKGAEDTEPGILTAESAKGEEVGVFTADCADGTNSGFVLFVSFVVKSKVKNGRMPGSVGSSLSWYSLSAQAG